MNLHGRDRIAVEYYWPGTRAGDGRPVTGVAFYSSMSPQEAWDEHERRLYNGERELSAKDEVIVRAAVADDLPDLRPIHQILELQELR